MTKSNYDATTQHEMCPVDILRKIFNCWTNGQITYTLCVTVLTLRGTYYYYFIFVARRVASTQIHR